MKAKVCPECGKHNLENAWSCVDCGHTLSIKTLVEIESYIENAEAIEAARRELEERLSEDEYAVMMNKDRNVDELIEGGGLSDIYSEGGSGDVSSGMGSDTEDMNLDDMVSTLDEE